MVESPSHYPQNHGQDLTDWFVRHGFTVADLTDLLASAETVEKPVEPDRSAGVLRFFRGRKFAPALLARAIMEDVDIVSDPETGRVYRWEGRFWECYDLSHIRKKALVMLEEEGSSSKAADVANMISDLSTLPTGRKMNDHEDLICLENGMFNLRTGEITPHAKEHYATCMLPITFDPKNVPDCPTWKRCLDQWLRDKASIREAQKYAGYCLTRETRWERMLFLIGPGGDGKSTFCNIIESMVGEDNCSNVAMGDLEDQFYRSVLVDKLVNIYTEIDSKAMQSTVIKGIVSGDKMMAAFKNQTPFKYRPFCKLIYSANRLPKVLDNSDGFFRKIIILRFDGQFVKRGAADIYLQDKLLGELSGIFAWALAGLDMLQEEGFRESAGMLETLADYKRVNNNILYYLEQHIQPDPAGKAGKAAVYEDYTKRCRSWNLLPIGEPQFRREFLRLLMERDMEVRDGKLSSMDESGRRPNCYIGFRIVDEKDSDDPPPSPSAVGPS